MLFIVCALGNWAWGPFAHTWVFLLALLADRRRLRRGQPLLQRALRPGDAVDAAAGQGRRRGVAGVFLVIGVSTLLRSRADWSLDLPVNPIAVVFAVLMLAYSAAVTGLRPHHVVIWGSLFIAGALPVWTGGDPSNVGLVMCGVAVMVNGVFDHLALVRTFGPATPSLGRG